MAINPALADLRQFYACNNHPQQPQQPEQCWKTWELCVLLVSSAAIAIFGTPIFSFIGMAIFCWSTLKAVEMISQRWSYSREALQTESDNREALRLLSIPGFFDFACQDQRNLVSLRAMRDALYEFRRHPRPAEVFVEQQRPVQQPLPEPDVPEPDVFMEPTQHEYIPQL